MGIIFNSPGPQQHVPVVENKIKLIKERVRAIIHSLPYKLPLMLLKWCVAIVVTRLNMLPSSTRMDPTSPRDLLLGRKIDFTTDLRLGFGDYVQAKVQNSISNSMDPRTEGAIALTSLGNVQGSWKFYCLSTGRMRTHDQWTVLSMPVSVIDHLNVLADPLQQGCAGLDPTFALGVDKTSVPAILQEPEEP